MEPDPSSNVIIVPAKQTNALMLLNTVSKNIKAQTLKYRELILHHKSESLKYLTKKHSGI